MRKVAKIVAYIIDVALTPFRALLALEVLVTAAVLSDESVKDALLIWVEQMKVYPSLLKEATKNIFLGEGA